MRGLSGAIGMDKTRGGISLLWQLILLELMLSVIFVVLGHLIGSAYFRGVGVGLVISWVTSVLAYYITERRKKKVA
jgi:cytochrome b subunit of formate dehydrogenase